MLGLIIRVMFLILSIILITKLIMATVKGELGKFFLNAVKYFALAYFGIYVIIFLFN